MNKVGRYILIHLNAFFPFGYPVLKLVIGLRYFRGIYQYAVDMIRYQQLQSKEKTPFTLSLKESYPIFFDRYESAGEIPKHYFLLDLWAAKKVFLSKTKLHYDVGSRLDGFIGQCLVFCSVCMLDVRPLDHDVPGLKFFQTDATNMRNIKSSSISSISSLHAIEHFGLGRYGDRIKPNGYLLAIQELQRVTKKGGSIYFATPIGRQRLQFNAHRVFDPMYITALFSECTLSEFSAIDDDDIFQENTDPAKFSTAFYSCGMFHFIKK